MSPQKLKVTWFLASRFSVICSMVMKSMWKISGCNLMIFRPGVKRSTWRKTKHQWHHHHHCHVAPVDTSAMNWPPHPSALGPVLFLIFKCSLETKGEERLELPIPKAPWSLDPLQHLREISVWFLITFLDSMYAQLRFLFVHVFLMSYFSLVIHSFNFRFDMALQDDPVWVRFWIVPVLSSLSDGVKDLSGRHRKDPPDQLAGLGVTLMISAYLEIL